MRKLLLVLLLVVVAAVAAGLTYLRSDAFQETLRRRLEERARLATGLDCRIRSARLDPFTRRFSIGGFELHALPGDPRPLDLSIDAVDGQFRFLSVWTLKTDFSEIHIVRPRIKLALGEHAMDPEKIMEALRVSLDLAARRVVVEGGQLELSDRTIPIDLALRDAACEISYRARPPAYAVHLRYRDGRVQWSGRELAYELDTRLLVKADGIAVESYDVRAGGTSLRGAGSLTDWKAPALDLRASGLVSAAELSIAIPELREGRGDAEVTAELRWDARGLRAAGRFAAARSSYRDVAAEGLSASFAVDGSRLEIRQARGKMGGGTFEADGELAIAAQPAGRHRFKISTSAVPLRYAAKLLELPGLALDNTMDAAVELSWRRGLADLDLRGNVRLHSAPAREGGVSTALQGEAELRYANGSWVIPSCALSSPETEIHASGHDATRMHIQLRTSRLGEPIGVARNFVPQLDRILGRYPDVAGAAGTYELDGDIIVMPMGKVAYEGSVRIHDGKFRSYATDDLSASASWNGSDLELRGLEVRRGEERAKGDLTLVLPPEGEDIRNLEFRGQLEGVKVQTLAELGVDAAAEWAGTVLGRGTVRLREGEWSGSGDVELRQGRFRDESFDALRARVETDGGTLRIADGEARLGVARATFRGRVDLGTRALDLTAALVGMPLAEIPALAENRAIGTLTGQAEIRGTVEKPSAKGRFELQGLRYEAWQLGGGRGEFELKDGEMHGGLQIRSELGSVVVQGRASTASGYPGSARVEFKDWDLKRLTSEPLPQFLSELSTVLEGSVKIDGPFADPSRWTAAGEMDGARFKIHDYELRNSGKIRFTLAERRVRVEELKLVGDGSSMTVSGDIPVDPNASMNLRLTGTLNLRFLEHVEHKLRVAGSAGLDVRATGSVSNPQVIGVAALNNARFDYGELPFHLSGMHGNVVFSRNLVRFENVEGSAASGTIRVGGTMEHENAEIRSVSLSVTARNARATYPKDLRSVVDADLNVRGGIHSLVVTGDVSLVRSEYVRDFNLLEQLAARSAAPQGPLISDPRIAAVALNVSITSDDGLFIDNELTKLRGRMHLTLRGSLAYPSLTGRVEATEGSIFFRGNRFEIIHAAADFVDRNRINPVLDIRAESDVKTYRLLLDVSGNLDNLRFNVSSDPPLSTVDILSLLTTGKSFEGGRDSSRRQAEITGLSAASILSESLTGVIGKRVQRIFGFQSFRVDPFLAGAENDPTARVTISERISKDMTVTFSRNLSKSEEQIVLVEYYVNKNLSVIATRDEDGKFGLDFRFRKRLR